MHDDSHRCPDVRSDMRCELVADHRSMHAARSEGALFHWRDPAMPPEHAKRISLHWADEVSAEL